MVATDTGRRPAELRRARVATSLLFFLFGTALGAWTSRIPAVQARLGLSDGRLSIALLCFALGAIFGMVLLGRLADRFGSTAVMVPTAVGEGLLLIPPGFASNLVVLAIALFVFGSVHGTLNIAMNANGIQVQRAWGRPILSSFHAVYSIGGFAGSAVGGLLARGGMSAGATFVAVGAGVVALAVWAALWALPAHLMPPHEERPQTPPGSRLRVRLPYDLLFLGLLAMCALVGEGTAADWSAVYLHDNLKSTAGFAALAFSAFSVMMTVGRLLGDRLCAAFGPVLLVRVSGVLASVGMLAALAVDRPVAGVVGFACLGAGMSCIAPQVFSAAGNRDTARAGAALSIVVSIGYMGFLIGPIIIGSVSTVIGLPRALTIPALLVLFVAVAASALRPRPAPPQQAEHSEPSSLATPT
ncbi:MAG TPA: MFS transporter [Actinocrinis sp.]|jgi:predicted MFS family arabinose efflux permease